MARTRGTYGPLDRDRHFVTGWAVDQGVDVVRDRTVGRVLRPVLPVVEGVSAGRRGVSRLQRAAALNGGRGEADRPAASVGHELFHAGSDRHNALAMLSTEFQVLASDLAAWLEQHPEDQTTARWLSYGVTPTIEEWRGFVDRQRASWWTRTATNWETYECWRDRLVQLRALAHARGITLHSADPAPLPKTLWERGAAGKGTELTAVLGVVKVAAVTALTITGAASLYTMLKKFHGAGSS